ncbi:MULTISPECIES: LCP family protein [Nonomuraea]|uniref:LCP family protein n=1 Tax=Nonomuraea harbinensis TaxID=1286938 RepID=A0ABW1C582_9ACTN|nr:MULTISPECIES: LCP family protein [Nonomuraea]TXK35355.1 LytR family transcriptional regulator [Nonomuraea sp. C10]
MDDLKLLRDFGRRLEHEPPATLVRQRERLLGAVEGRPRRRWFGWMAAGLVAVATVATVAAVAVPALLLGDLRRTAQHPVGARPAKVTEALNVLLVGTDKGSAPRMADDKGRTDSIILLHLPADRKRTTAVSIPRDSLVQLPACGSAPARTDLINSAYNRGGLTCTVKAVESLTDVRIDHMAEVDFAGFGRLVDALGGIEVTLKRAVDDPKAKLTLPAGKSLLDGERAVGYMRLRSVGDGSDIARIKRQQTVIRAMAKKAGQVLDEPAKLKTLASVVADSVTTDTELDVERMIGIAMSLHDSTVKLVTVPWIPHPEDRNRIAWKQPEAEKLFASLR